MTRLKNLLLAGTLVPALALPPVVSSWAQQPGFERGGPGARGGAEGPGGGAGGPRGQGAQRGGAERGAAEAPRGGAPGEGRGPRPERAPAAAERTREPAVERRAPQPAAAERREAPAPRAAPAERAVERPAKAAPPERAAERPAKRMTPAEMVGEHPGKMTPAERVGNRPEAPGKMAPVERGAEPREAPARMSPTERGAAAREAPGRMAPAERGAEKPRQMTPAERGAERAGAPGVPPAGRAPNAAVAPVAPGQPAARYNDPSTPQGGGFRNGGAAPGRGPNGEPIGPNGRDERGDNRGYDNRGDNRGYDNRGDRDGRRGGISPGGAAAIGAAAGFAGGFLAATGARDLEGIRRDRRETVEDGRTYIREPGRTIVDEGGGRSFIVHDENDRFRELGYDVRRERRGNDYVDVINRPDGIQILTFTTPDGRMLRRVRRYNDGREVVLIDNSYDGGVRSYTQDVVDLPPPRYDLPRERYDVDYARADEGSIYETLIAPPVARPPKRYTLDQIRYSPDIRRYVRSVDINTINFASGSWIVPAAATGKLQALGAAIKRAVTQNPDSVFLVEGYTDATGNPNDNLSLSDHRAQSVAAILSKDFGVPPENLTTQGYGQQNLKVNTQGPSEENRRVVVQNITQLMADNGGKGPSPR